MLILLHELFLKEKESILSVFLKNSNRKTRQWKQSLEPYMLTTVSVEILHVLLRIREPDWLNRRLFAHRQ